MFSYNSAAASFCPFSLLDPLLSSSCFTYFNRSFSSGDPRLAKGSPMTITARAKSSLKFNPSESFAPITAKRIAPFLLTGGVVCRIRYLNRFNQLGSITTHGSCCIFTQYTLHVCRPVRLKEHLTLINISLKIPGNKRISLLASRRTYLKFHLPSTRSSRI